MHSFRCFYKFIYDTFSGHPFYNGHLNINEDRTLKTFGSQYVIFIFFLLQFGQIKSIFFFKALLFKISKHGEHIFLEQKPQDLGFQTNKKHI